MIDFLLGLSAVCLSVCLTCLSVCLVCLSVCLSVCLYYVLRSLGTAKRNTAAKRKTLLRFARPPLILRFGSYAVEIIITFCVNLLRFALRFYVLGNVAFCGPTSAIRSRRRIQQAGFMPGRSTIEQIIALREIIQK